MCVSQLQQRSVCVRVSCLRSVVLLESVAHRERHRVAATCPHVQYNVQYALEYSTVLYRELYVGTESSAFIYFRIDAATRVASRIVQYSSAVSAAQL